MEAAVNFFNSLYLSPYMAFFFLLLFTPNRGVRFTVDLAETCFLLVLQLKNSSEKSLEGVSEGHSLRAIS